MDFTFRAKLLSALRAGPLACVHESQTQHYNDHRRFGPVLSRLYDEIAVMLMTAFTP